MRQKSDHILKEYFPEVCKWLFDMKMEVSLFFEDDDTRSLMDLIADSFLKAEDILTWLLDSSDELVQHLKYREYDIGEPGDGELLSKMDDMIDSIYDYVDWLEFSADSDIDELLSEKRVYRHE